MTRQALPLLILALLLGLGVRLPTAHAEVAQITLGRLGGIADAIVVGRVARTIEVPVETLPDAEVSLTKATVAEVVVLEWLKGKPRPKTLWYWAEGTWTCDVTQAIKGERGLYFLEATGVGDLVTPESMKRLSKATLGAPLYRVAWSGRGRMPFRTIAGRDYATIWEGAVEPPSTVDTIPGPDPRYTEFKRGVSLDDLRQYLRFRLLPVPKPSEVKGLDPAGLLRALDGPYEVRQAAQDALGNKAEALLPTLRTILRDASSPLRENAASALECIDEEGRDAVLDDLRSGDLATRRAAAFAAERIGVEGIIWGNAAKKAMSRALVDPDPEVRWRMLRFLAGGYADFKGDLAKAVVKALQDESREVRWHAARCVLRLYRFYEDGPRPEAERSVVEQHLLAMAATPDPKIRRAVWEALGVTATKASWEAARTALSDSDPVVRVNAAGALALMGSTESTRALISLLGEADPWMRRMAAHGLGLSQARVGVEPLVKTLKDTDETTRRLSAWALGRIGTPAAKAVPALEALLETERNTAFGAEIRDAVASIRRK